MKLFTIPAFVFLVGSLFIPLIRNEIVKKAYVIILPVIGFINLLMLKPGATYSFKFVEGFNLILLKVDKLSWIVGFIFILIGFFALLYSLHVKENAHHMLGLWYIGTSLGAVFAGDFLTLYIFWELMTIASTGLVLLKNDEESRAAAFRYLIMHLIGGLLLLGGIWLHYLNTSSIALTHLASGLPLVLVLAGIGVNSAFVFLHTWLPDTYPRALFTASVFMSVYTTKTAVYLLARVASGWDFVAYMGAAMAVFGVSMALMQNNSRKLLSYHIVSQVGYMVAAIGIGGAVGVDGGIFHLFNHILYKALLFMTIGAAIYMVGKENLHELGGLSRKMPITTAAAVVASLSISGAPLFNGFVSKSIIFEAAHSNDILYLTLELAAIGTFLSFLKFTYYGFIKPNKEIEAKAKEAPLNMTIAMGSVAALCFAIGVFPGLITKILPFSTKIPFYTGEHIIGIMQLIAVSVIAFAWGSKKIFAPHNRLTFDFDFLYIKIVEGMALFPRLLSDFNNWLEAKSERIPYYLSLTKKPLFSFTNYLSDTLFVLWVDFWLFLPAGKLGTQTHTETEELSPLENNLLFRPFYWFMKFLDNVSNRMSKAASFFDSNIVDKTAEGVANVMFSQKEVLRGHKISSLANLFDNIVVDGIVNGVARIVFFFGATARRMQTGLVQSYALIIVFALAFAIFALSIKGGFK